MDDRRPRAHARDSSSRPRSTCSPRAGPRRPRTASCRRRAGSRRSAAGSTSSGAANPFAVDEYRAVRDRLETLDAQDKDLRDAIAKTRQLIADLDELIATQFRATFAQLELAFDARFQQLFGGGFAKLVLTDPTDLSATGIEITARPPGKKPQALAMLSGGERALTAVALLFAMLEVRPAPFCVLDEVDAALDEANVGRFTEALRSARRPDPVHRHHPQPRHDRGRRRALRRHGRRRLGQPRDQPPPRRGEGHRRHPPNRGPRGPRRRRRLTRRSRAFLPTRHVRAAGARIRGRPDARRAARRRRPTTSSARSGDASPPSREDAEADAGARRGRGTVDSIAADGPEPEAAT